MTAVPSDIPGYCQGFVFSDDAQYYDSVGKRWYDQAGYGSFNDAVVSVGSPTFATVNGQRVWVMDNTCHARFIPANPWEGFTITVMKPTLSANGNLYVEVHGEATTVTSNGLIRLSRATGPVYQHRVISPAGAVNAICDYGSDTAMKVSMYARSQQTRQPYSSIDGGTTLVTGSAISETAGQDGNALCLSNVITSIGSSVVANTSRLGNLSGTIGDTVATSGTVQMAERHSYRFVNGRNPFLTDAATLLAVWSALKTKYGI